MKSKNRSECPINFSLELLGDKWTMLVIRDMIFEGKFTYKEFLSSKERIATNILSERLKSLEACGIIQKLTLKTKAKVGYWLTDKGIELIPIILELGAWGARHSGYGWEEKILKKMKSDKRGLIRNLTHDIQRRGPVKHEPIAPEMILS
ncbi:transcriptional regulator [Chitinophaga caeni]|uniref:Transcriptional regulator n=1 Tax=Chitinophaga caeni TaxID=2029983 RepID=A0A291QQT0_9BACT|nr:helix-turn-helix domain-containing protein [Chitinophaga caeni]ATL46194.1 transcriptional regulator [Chitinophaga caeni]